MYFRKTVLLISILSSLSVSSFAIDQKHEAGLEFRAYDNDHNADTYDYNVALAIRSEYKGQYDGFKQKLRYFLRVDSQDSKRNRYIMEELWVGKMIYPFQFRFGYQLLNWTALEAFHPAAVINSRNYDSNLENAEKYGELMLSASYLMDLGSVSFYFMPTVVAPTYPDPKNRLSFLSTGLGPVTWVNTQGHIDDNFFFPQFAVRFDRTLDNADVSLHYIYHQDRSQPVFVPNNGKITPVFLPVSQIGGTLQYLWKDSIIKSEWAYRNFHDAPNTGLGAISQYDHLELALGYETTFYHDSGKDSTVIVEYQCYEGISASERVALGYFQHDVLIGHRFVFNDVSGKELFTSVIADLDHGDDYMAMFRYEQRIKDNWTIQAGIRVFEGNNFDNADQIYMNVKQYL